MTAKGVCTKLPSASVDEMRTLVAPGCKIGLCHYPMRDWNGQYGGDVHSMATAMTGCHPAARAGIASSTINRSSP